MASYLIGRHAGAVDWIIQQGKKVDHVLTHLDIEVVQKGDTIIGTLPVHLVYQICQKGAHYYHLSMEIPEELRGVELSAEQMNQCRARLEEYVVLQG